MLGKTLINRYRIDAELGHGGMGVVYRCYDNYLNRLVAIKIISVSSIGPESRHRFLAEARAVAKLNHPNIVTVFDAVDADGVPFIVMELVEGGILRFNTPPGVQKTVEFIRQICSALAHAHSNGIIHRDIKPDNVLIASNGSVKLMDFGLALNMDTTRMTDAGTLVGTFAYLAPELIQGGMPSAQSDIYSLGVMLFELLTGQLPFPGKDIAQLLADILYGKIPSVKTINSDIPDLLDSLVNQLLDRDPNKRPQSAIVVEQVLASLQFDRVINNQELSPQDLGEMVNLRTPARKEWEKDWRRKSYPKSSVPVLGVGERELIIANRKNELASCISQLNDHRLLVITGMPGIGKSTLARVLLEFMPPEAPPPFWYDFDRQKGTGNSLSVLLDRIAAYLERCLGGNVRDEILSFRNLPDSRASVNDIDVMIDFLNQEISLWMVFDNLESVLIPGGNGFIHPGLENLFDGLRSNSHNAKIVITSPLLPVLQDGEFLLEFGSQPMTLQGLDEISAISFLRANGLQDLQDEVLVSVARMVDGHPFALKHVARYIVAMGVEAALDSLHGGLDDFLEHFQQLLRQRLSESEYLVLSMLTVLQREIPIDGICQTAQTRPAMIKRLREAGLLEKNQAANFWLPSLVRLSLRSQDVDLDRLSHQRAMEYYSKQRRIQLPKEIGDYAFAIEYHFHAIQVGDAPNAYAAVFSTGMGDSLSQWNEYTLLGQLCEKIVILLPSEQKILSNSEWINLNHTLAKTTYYLNKYKKSLTYSTIALNAMSSDGDPLLRVTLLIRMCEANINLGVMKFVDENCEELFDLLNNNPDDFLFGRTLFLRGIAHHVQGRIDQAIQDFEHAREIFQRLKKDRQLAYIAGELGRVYCDNNQFEIALENYRTALVLSDEIKDIRGVMLSHFNIGDVYLQQENYELARQEFSSALNLASKKKFYSDVIASGLFLAEAQLGCGQMDQARINLESLQSLIANDESQVFPGQAQRIRAGLDWRMERFEAAKEGFHLAFALLKGDDCRYEKARADLEYAFYLQKIGQEEQAIMSALEAKNGFEKLKYQLGAQSAERAILGFRKSI